MPRAKLPTAQCARGFRTPLLALLYKPGCPSGLRGWI